MTEWSNVRQNLEHMRASAMLTRANSRKPDPQLDGLIAKIDRKIERAELNDDGHASGDTPGDRELDDERTLRVKGRTTTFRLNGKSVTFGEFRRAAERKGVDMEMRLKLDNKPERFTCRAAVRAE